MVLWKTHWLALGCLLTLFIQSSLNAQPQACPIYVAHELHDGELTSVARDVSNSPCIAGSADWSNLDHSRQLDQSYTEIVMDRIQRAQCLRLQNFDLNIPPGSVINGLQAEFFGHREGSSVITTAVYLLDKDGDRLGRNQASWVRGDDWPMGMLGMDDKWWYGGHDQLWGANLTEDILNDPDFGIEFQIRKPIGSDTTITRLDHVKLTVFFTPLYTICHDSCTVFYVDPIPEAQSYHWTLPPNAQFVSKDPNSNIINLNVKMMNFGIHEICVQTESAQGLSTPCCSKFRLAECQSGTIGDFVWNDSNNNGRQDAGENGVPNIELKLYEAFSKSEIATTQTDNDGLYNFPDIGEGHYYIEMNLPQGFNYSPFLNSDHLLDSDFDQSNGPNTSRTFYLPSGQDLESIDVGIYAPTFIGDFVFLDNNHNGIQDVGERGISNVQVILLDQFGMSVDTTQTDSVGFYQFNPTTSGDFQLKFDVPSQHISTSQNQGNDDDIDSDIDINGFTGIFSISFGQNIENLDAGFCPFGKLTGTAFYDREENGLQDIIDPVINNIRVLLTDENNNILSSTLTDTLGTFCFDSLLADDYKIKFEKDSSFIFSPKDVGNDDSIDSDVDHNGESDLFTTTGIGQWDIDAGCKRNCNIESAVLSLKKKTNCYNGSAFLFDFQSTIPIVIPASYEVIYIFVNATTGNIIAGSNVPIFSINQAGDYEIYALIYNFDPNDPEYLDINSYIGANDPFEDVLTKIRAFAICHSLSTPLTFRIDDCGQIDGTVWLDKNRDGQRQTSENMIVDVEILLLDQVGAILQRDTTGADGRYVFSQLPVGDYQVRVILPNQSNMTDQDIGNDATDCDFDVVGNSSLQSVTSGLIITLDAGLFYTCSLQLADLNPVPTTLDCYKGIPVNVSAQFASAPMVPQGYKVIYFLIENAVVLDSSSNAQFILGGIGNYNIVALLYDSRVASPDYLDLSFISLGTTTKSNIESKIRNEFICASFSSEASFILENCVSIAGRIFYDQNENGIQDLIDLDLEGVEIQLKDQIGIVLDRDTTDIAGRYAFNDINSGIFEIKAIALADHEWSAQDQGNDDMIDSDLDLNGNLGNIMLLPGSNASIDGGLFISCDILSTTIEKLELSKPCLGSAPIQLSASTSGGNLNPGFVQRYLLVDVNGLILGINDLPDFAISTLGGFGIVGIVYNNDPTSPEYFDSNFIVVGSTTLNDLGNYLDEQFICSSISSSIGIIQIKACGQISGLVWEDNENGLREAGENGLKDIEVRLLDANNLLVSTTMTNDTGYYEFADLIQGIYKIECSQPAGYIFSPQDVGMDDTIDSDVDQNGLSSSLFLLSGIELKTDIGLSADCEVLLGAIENIQLSETCWYGESVNLTATEIDKGTIPNGFTLKYLMSRDGWIYDTSSTPEFIIDSFGVYCIHALIYDPRISSRNYFDLDVVLENALTTDETYELIFEDERCAAFDLDGLCIEMSECAKIGDFVWLDSNEDGIQDMNEEGVDNVEVALYDRNDQLMQTTVTSTVNGEKGAYLFEKLDPGFYYIEVRLPFGFNFSPSKQGGDDQLDSDIDNSNGPGTTPLLLTTGTNNLDWDAGIFPVGATISDLVWEDLNANGIQEAGEPGINGLELELIDGNGLILSTTVTQNLANQDGRYEFTGLPVGRYHIRIANPGSFIPTPSGVGGDFQVDSDLNEDNGLFTSRTINLIINQFVDHFDLGLYRHGILGDRIWYDENNNGVQDIGETGVNDVKVRLLDTMNQLIDSTISRVINGEPGLYFFDSIVPGTYVIQVDPMMGTVFTNSLAGNDPLLDSDITGNRGQGTSRDILFLSNGRDSTIDAGLTSSSCVGDYVWNEVDFNGLLDFFERGLNDIKVYLKDANGFIIDSTQTNNDVSGNPGYYHFENVQPGNYYMEFKFEDRFCSTLPDVGMDEDIDSDVTNANGPNTTDLFSVSIGDTIKNIDLGLSEKSSIGDFVWCDETGDGLQDSSEPGINGIRVILFTESGNSVDTTFTDNFPNTTTAGYYEFSDIVPGNYYLVFGQAPDKVQTLANAGNDESLDSDVDNSNGFGSTSVISLSPGESESDIDAGYIDPGLLLSTIGDYTWLDRDNDGIQDGFENGLNGVVVEMYNMSDSMIATTTSDYHPQFFSPGYYEFTDIQAGQYYLVFTPPNGYEFAASYAGLDDSKDSDISNVKTYGSTNILPLFAGEQKMSIDAGFVQYGSLGDFFWIDQDADGIQDPAEDGFNGVQITLYNRQGEKVDSTVTERDHLGQDGWYVFNDIEPGGYYLHFSLPQGYAFTEANSGGDDTKDSDINHTNGFGTTSIINISPGEHDRDADGGIHEQGIIGRRVWMDANYNGLQDPGEKGFSNIPVKLYDTNDSMLYQTVSDSMGFYEFDKIPMGEFYVRFDAPRGFTFTTTAEGGENEDSDVTHRYGIGTTDAMLIYPGDQYFMLDAGIVRWIALAVQIEDFDAIEKDGKVDLDWKMRDESSVMKHDIERKDPGDNQFKTVYSTEVKSNLFGQYHSVDLLEESGIYFYRLKITTQNGKEEYSIVRSVEKEGADDKVKVYPNPTTDYLVVENQSKTKGLHEIEIRSMDSKLWLTRSTEESLTKLDLRNIPAGMYVITVFNAEKILLKQMIQVVK